MEQEYISVDDIPEQELPFYLRESYRVTPFGDFATYINRVTLNYNRKMVHTRYMMPMCFFNVQSSGIDEDSSLFLNFTVYAFKDLDLRLEDFLDTYEIKGYKIYDVGTSCTSKEDPKHRYSDIYDRYELTLFFRAIK